MVGYHVTQPCESCMDACNNGHFWMFHCNEVTGTERTNPTSKKHDCRLANQALMTPTNLGRWRTANVVTDPKSSAGRITH